jgi:chemotaxis protein MotB
MSKRPIIVIKKKGAHGGHHGGAWKVAYADFVTAMMSLFIVLWLMNSTPQIKKAVSGYFNDPLGRASDTGTDRLGDGPNISIDEKNVAKLRDAIQKAIMKQADLSKLSKNVKITITNEGLRIELLEDKGGTFFDSGSARMSDTGIKLLDVIASQLLPLPNHLMIEGHTDAQPYSADNTYTNWDLSTDRANSARRVLQQQGLPDSRISQVRGYADQMLRVPADPTDPSNRRISLIVQWVAVPPAAPSATPGATASFPKNTAPAGNAAKGESAAAKGEGAPLPVAATVSARASPAAATTSGLAKPRPGVPASNVAGATPAQPNPSTAPAKAQAPAKPIATTPKPAAVVAKPGIAVVAKPSMIERLKQMLPGKKK